MCIRQDGAEPHRQLKQMSIVYEHVFDECEANTECHMTRRRCDHISIAVWWTGPMRSKTLCRHHRWTS